MCFVNFHSSFPNYCQQDATFLNLFISTDALHVSGGSSAHHQEHRTVHTASGIVNQYCCLQAAVLVDSTCPWVRGGFIACGRGQGRFRCCEDVYPSNRSQRTVEILQPPFFLASLVFWLFIASVFFGIILSPVHVCIHFETPV